MAAQMVDAIREQTYVLLRVNGSKDARPPEPITRPGSLAAESQVTGSLADFNALIGG